MKKDKWLGHMVRIKNFVPGGGAGRRGEVIARVREGKGYEYIVQFPSAWCFFSPKEMKVEE